MALRPVDSHYEGMEGLGKRCAKSERVSAVGSHVCALESRSHEGSEIFFEGLMLSSFLHFVPKLPCFIPPVIHKTPTQTLI